ncbi:thiamine pyrophosphate-dependent dehydrogenase E1 component subunit alpha [Akkermansiaceae bacterium]|jgi:pyruvate dehydrogenase E1 component alpha subunit/2-oxoisovalerate dehydrogenase E1 component alpha subunit|nr:thiamine pyrophosphate-dependent dehydrogenase E1 component subunit alpha [Akkermansiaceae bacterium]MDB4488649.1 thiamine pyrophosphate-dependent dehydrogenase E1 component subunit alpha [Akkermansiaceae bacterium]MDB4502062.1 thiamine pyrophosphate-dependent dehydrogenase E1 component subunit alpha [Akkermansiaceae bacterium]
MIISRTLESKLSSLYKAGKIVGGVYLGTGQEAFSASLGCSLDQDKDIFAPLIRDQAGRTGFGEPLIEATRTYLGSALGPMRGRDGNIHRGRPADRRPAMISHLGTSVSVVAGMLIARRMKGELAGVVGATCVGDGATSTGAFHEGLNLAAVEQLPMVVLVADNQFAYSTPRERQFACENLVDRAKGYGVTGREVDATNLLECLSVVHEAVQAARSGGGPQMVVGKLLRLCGHGEHDDASYVASELKNSKLGRDCLELGIEQVIEKGIVTENEIDLWQKEAAEEVQEAVANAQTDPRPDPYRDDWRAFSSKGINS